MRPRSVFAILGAVLVGLAVTPAQARQSVVVANHFGGSTFRPFASGRTAGSLRTHGSQFFAFDRSSGRVVAFDRRAFARSRRSAAFGFRGGGFFPRDGFFPGSGSFPGGGSFSGSVFFAGNGVFPGSAFFPGSR